MDQADDPLDGHVVCFSILATCPIPGNASGPSLSPLTCGVQRDPVPAVHPLPMPWLLPSLRSHSATSQAAGHAPRVDPLTGVRWLRVWPAPKTAETAQFARALWRLLAQAGFAHLGIETGPATAGILEQAAAAGPQQIVELAGRYFFSIPFFYWQEEMELLTVGPDSIPPRLWGLDQEFILSPWLHFDRLRDRARHPAQRALAGELGHRAHQVHTQMVENHDPEALFLLQIAPRSGSACSSASRGMKTRYS